MDAGDGVNIKQGSSAWFAFKAGKVSASQISHVVARTKHGWAASRANYMAQLLCERLTGVKEEGYTNAAMQWGIDKEPDARDAYMFLTDNEVQEVGFIDHPSIEMTGASPDGLVLNAGMLEIKCPNTATHLNTFLKGKIDGKYYDQMQWQMECAQREWCDFVSFDPRLPEEYQLYKKRVNRDDERIGFLKSNVILFNEELNEMIVSLKNRVQPPEDNESDGGA